MMEKMVGRCSKIRVARSKSSIANEVRGCRVIKMQTNYKLVHLSDWTTSRPCANPLKN